MKFAPGGEPDKNNVIAFKKSIDKNSVFACVRAAANYDEFALNKELTYNAAASV